jgi:hypothetical protein
LIVELSNKYVQKKKLRTNFAQNLDYHLTKSKREF